MLAIKYEYFCKDPDLLFSEMRGRGECGLVDMGAKGFFFIKYQAPIVANDPDISAEDGNEPSRD